MRKIAEPGDPSNSKTMPGAPNIIPENWINNNWKNNYNYEETLAIHTIHFLKQPNAGAGCCRTKSVTITGNN